MSVSDDTPSPFAKIGSTLRIRMRSSAELEAVAAVREAEGTPEEGEWPKRDAVPFVREAEVTPELLADAEEFEAYFASDFNTFAEIAAGIYRAMHAVAPMELISEAEERADQYRRQRDNIIDESIRYVEQINALQAENTRLQDALKVTTRANQDQAESLAALLEECARLHDLLAQRPAPVPDTPKLAVVIREHRNDRRRLGLA